MLISGLETKPSDQQPKQYVTTALRTKTKVNKINSYSLLFICCSRSCNLASCFSCNILSSWSVVSENFTVSLVSKLIITLYICFGFTFLRHCGQSLRILAQNGKENKQINVDSCKKKNKANALLPPLFDAIPVKTVMTIQRNYFQFFRIRYKTNYASSNIHLFQCFYLSY